jgi:fructose-1,6-bisphosphatase/sedoheptulose 1,7-bisphosphatase-like protein
MSTPNDTTAALAAEGIQLNLFKSFDSIERDVANILAHSTAVAALNAAHARGRNQRKFADQLAVDAMREVLDKELPISAEVVIGEGVRDEAPMLYIGERLGPYSDEPQMTIAVDPLEGTNLCARGEPGAITVIAAALTGQGQLMGGIDGYFDKVVVGKDLAQKVNKMREGHSPALHIKVDSEHGLIDNSVKDIIRWVAYERQKSLREVVAMVLERDRNEPLVAELRALNTQVLLIGDGDITAGLLAMDPNRDVDIALGIGAAPEGVITAAICKVFQGYMETRWWLDDPKRGTEHRVQLKERGVDPKTLYSVNDLAQGHVMFALTGVTYNQYTPGVQYLSGGSAITHTIYGRSRSGTVYERRAIHQNPPPPPNQYA